MLWTKKTLQKTDKLPFIIFVFLSIFYIVYAIHVEIAGNW